MATSILLEAGTNELELLIFRVGALEFGVNVAKVRELAPEAPAISIPNTPPAIKGSFKIRDEVLSLISLSDYLAIAQDTNEVAKRLIIILELNNIKCGILVDGVEMIHRLRWEQIEPPSAYLAYHNIPFTSVARINERVILVLDFERIVGELLGAGGTGIIELESPPEVPEHAAVRVLLVDDSPTIRDSLEKLLHNAGFKNTTKCGDGQEAWDLLTAGLKDDALPFDIVLTDIEMPRMDGLHLTARIKEHAVLKNMPVVLFSSLVRHDTTERWKTVGADAQITKFNHEELLCVLDRCLGR